MQRALEEERLSLGRSAEIGCYSPSMEKVRIEAQLPAALADQARAFVDEGGATDLDELRERDDRDQDAGEP